MFFLFVDSRNSSVPQKEWKPSSHGKEWMLRGPDAPGSQAWKLREPLGSRISPRPSWCGRLLSKYLALGRSHGFLGTPKNTRSSSWQWEITHWYAVIDDLWWLSHQERGVSVILFDCLRKLFNFWGWKTPNRETRDLHVSIYTGVCPATRTPLLQWEKSKISTQRWCLAQKSSTVDWDHPILVIQSCWTNPKKMSEPGTRTWSRMLPVSMGTTCKIFHIWQGGAIHFHSFSAS